MAEIRYKDGEIDEVVAEGRIHLERLDDGVWMLNIDEDRTFTSLRLMGKKRIDCFVFEESEKPDQFDRQMADLSEKIRRIKKILSEP